MTAVVSLRVRLVGLSYWSLVIGTAVGTMSSTVMLWIAYPWRPTWTPAAQPPVDLGVQLEPVPDNALYLVWSQVGQGHRRSVHRRRRHSGPTAWPSAWSPAAQPCTA